jgi:DNA invertase Pin-like site-specific DNA recombinase
LSAALAGVYEHGAGVLIVAEHTRLARDELVAYDAIDRFKVAGPRVIYANGNNDDTDESAPVNGIGHVIAAYDRRRIVKRTREGIAEKRREHPRSQAQGGKVAYGYRRTPTEVVIDAEQAAVVRAIFDRVRRESVRSVAASLGMHPATVAGIVKRPVYKSKRNRIVSPRIWQEAQDALAARRKR